MMPTLSISKNLNSREVDSDLWNFYDMRLAQIIGSGQPNGSASTVMGRGRTTAESGGWYPDHLRVIQQTAFQVREMGSEHGPL